jgi:hypothetical protein
MSDQGENMENTSAKQPLAVVSSKPRASIAQRQPATYEELKQIAVAFAQSGFFEDAKSAAQCYVKILAGVEFGLGPMAAMQGIYIIKGKPTMAATTIAGIIKKSGVYDYRVQFIEDPTTKAITGCSIDFYQEGQHLGNSTFTQEDAAKAGLSSSDMYRKFFRNMSFSRAMTNGTRWFVPDVFGGPVYSPDEIEPDAIYDGSGRPLNMPALPAPNAGDPAPTEPNATPQRKALSIKALRELYVEALLPEGKFVEWLEMMVDFKQVEDAITGKLTPPNDAQKIKAEDELRKIIAERNPPPPEPEAAKPTEREIADDEEAPPPPAAANEEVQQASLAFAEQTGADVGISDPQRKLIMAMFNDRKDALVAMYPELKTADARRHEFAAKALKNDAKRSSKNWTPSDFKVVHDKLELVPPDATE